LHAAIGKKKSSIILVSLITENLRRHKNDSKKSGNS